jgi:TDG/mug DNA glycosylase family protein
MSSNDSGGSAVTRSNQTETSRGFGPVSTADARILVLGSLPGVRSLEQTQYYAQPQNAFWRIMGELVGAAPDLPYTDRLNRLLDARIALWDVVAAAVRPGSLDSRIINDTVVVNDFAAFLASHRKIERICFNGQAAEKLFRRHVLPVPGLPVPQCRLILPSTSPANARMPYPEKLRRWRAILV